MFTTVATAIATSEIYRLHPHREVASVTEVCLTVKATLYHIFFLVVWMMKPEPRNGRSVYQWN